MKRFFAIILAGVMLLSVCACDLTPSNGTESSANSSESYAESSEGMVESEPSSSESASAGLETSDESQAESSATSSVNSTEATEDTDDSGEEETRPSYMIKEDKDMDTVLNSSLIFKLGYGFYYSKESGRATLEALPFEEDEEIYVSEDALKEKFNIKVEDYDKTVVDGVSYVNLSTFEGPFDTVYFEDYGVILITNYVLDFEDDSLIDELGFKANNLLALGDKEMSAQMSGERPVLFEDDEMLEHSKELALAGVEPYASSWKNVKSNADYALKIGPKPYTGSDCTEYRFAACDDMVYARYLAIAYRYTGEAKYLEGAILFLKTYSESNPKLGTSAHLDYSKETINGKSDIGLNIALPLTTACDAYSLIYPYLNNADKASIEAWLRIEAALVIEGHEYWIANDYYDNQYGNNHLTCHLMGIIAAAYALEDDELLAYALDESKNEACYTEMFDRAILMSGDDVWEGAKQGDIDDDFEEGEIYDRYRVVQNMGFGYSLYHLKFLTYCATMLYNNGSDYFIYYGTNGENLKLSYYVYADYLIENDNTLGVGHYEGSPIVRDQGLNIYYVANYYYNDEVLARVIKVLTKDGVNSADIEVFGRSTELFFAVEAK